MRNIAIFILLTLFMLPITGYCQDGIYGDYLLAYFDKRVSLDLEGAELVDVLKLLSQQTGLNFVSTEAVRERKLTLYMQEVPLKEAMDIVFKANHLAYDYYPDSNIFVIKEMGKPALELKTKIYSLKYVRVKSSSMEAEINSSLGEGRRGSSAEEGILHAIEQVLSDAGKVVEDSKTNSLIVVDVPTQFPVIDEVVNRLDIPSPKVMIEVEILDVSKTHLDKLGFNFANGLYARFAGGARSTHFPFGESLLKATTTQPTVGATSGATGLAPPVLGILDITSFTAVMQFLTQDTSTKFIARPKILTISNETAEVNLTVDEAIGVSSTTVEGGGTTTEDVERAETGTKLRVTPQVNSHTREITLFVDVFNRESTTSGLEIGSGSAIEGDIKNVEERGTKSVLRLKDGETLYIGGLIKKETSETNRKIPFLGDIPLLGKFFSYTERPSTDNLDRELLLFLTPRVMEDKMMLAKRRKVFSREQQNTSKIQSVKLALDSFTQ